MAVQKKTADNTKKKVTKKPVAKKSVTKSVAKSMAKKDKPANKNITIQKTLVKKPAAVKKAAVKTTVKKAVKKVATKKTAVKKSATKKSAAKGKTVTKRGKTTSELLKAIKARDIETTKNKIAGHKKTQVTKTTSKKRAAKKNIVKSTPLVTVPPMQKPVEIIASSVRTKTRKRRTKLKQKDLDKFMVELMSMRDHFIEQTDTMKNYALQRDDGANAEEDGTDSFMRLQALNQVKSQQKVIADIATALEAIKEGTYGTCEMCECLISKPRLRARPFTKFCINCKSEMERGHRHKK